MPVVLDLLANDRDPDGDPLALRSVASPPEGSAASLRGGLLRYAPPEGFTGEVRFDYEVEDGRGGQASAEVLVHVLAEGETQPVRAADDPRMHALSGVPTELDVLANDRGDPAGSLWVAEITEAPAHGTALAQGTVVTYQSEPGYEGTDTFAYRVEDALLGGQATAHVTVQVEPAPAPLPDPVPNFAWTATAQPKDLLLTTAWQDAAQLTLSFTWEDGSPVADQIVGIEAEFTSDMRAETSQLRGRYTFQPIYRTDAQGQVHLRIHPTARWIDSIALGDDHVRDAQDEAFPWTAQILRVKSDPSQGFESVALAERSGERPFRLVAWGQARVEVLGDDPPWVFAGPGIDTRTPVRFTFFDALGRPLPAGSLVYVSDVDARFHFPADDPPRASLEFAPEVLLAEGFPGHYTWPDRGYLVRLGDGGQVDAQMVGPHRPIQLEDSLSAATADPKDYPHPFRWEFYDGDAATPFPGAGEPAVGSEAQRLGPYADHPDTSFPRLVGPAKVAAVAVVPPLAPEQYYWGPGDIPPYTVQATFLDGRDRPLPEGAQLWYSAPAPWSDACGPIVERTFTDSQPPDLMAVAFRVDAASSVELAVKPMPSTVDLRPPSAYSSPLPVDTFFCIEGGQGCKVVWSAYNAAPMPYLGSAPALEFTVPASATATARRAVLLPFMTRNTVSFRDPVDSGGNPIPAGALFKVTATRGYASATRVEGPSPDVVEVRDEGQSGRVAVARFEAATHLCSAGNSVEASVSLGNSHGNFATATFTLLCPVVNFNDLSVRLRWEKLPVLGIPAKFGKLARAAERFRAQQEKILKAAADFDLNDRFDFDRATKKRAEIFQNEIAPAVVEVVKAVPNTTFTGPTDAKKLVEEIQGALGPELFVYGADPTTQQKLRAWLQAYLREVQRRSELGPDPCSGGGAPAPFTPDPPDLMLGSTSVHGYRGVGGRRVTFVSFTGQVHAGSVLPAGTAVPEGDHHVTAGDLFSDGDRQALGLTPGELEVGILETGPTDPTDGSVSVRLLVLTGLAPSDHGDEFGTAIIGSGGGNVGAGGFELVVPAGLLAQDTQVVVTGLAPFATETLPAGLAGADFVRVVEISSIDANDQVQPMSLGGGASLRAYFAPDPTDATRTDEGVRTATQALLYYDAAQGAWVLLGDSTVDPMAGYVTATPPGSGVYALVGLP
ncbi:MAG: hypothetical protein D6729_16915 [Deltaproteobacteria bacterium]|nr:MAG: hypothetical protein D6729_16915 [Deltaproteobacteria bacterium]